MRVACLGLVGLVLGGCIPLDIEPGSHFAVHVIEPEVRHLIQAGPIEVGFTVEGCNAFTARVRTRSLATAARGSGELSWDEHPLRYTSSGADRYQGQITVDTLVPGEWPGCSATSANPYTGELQLVISCTGDGRQAQSARVPVFYAAAHHSVGAWSSRTLLGINDPNHFVVITDSGFMQWHGEFAQDPPDWNHYVDAFQRQEIGVMPWSHVALQQGTTLYVTGRCAAPTGCEPFPWLDPATGETRQLPTHHLYTLDLSHHQLQAPLVQHVVNLPGVPSQAVFDADGALLFLTQLEGEERLVVRVHGDAVQVRERWRDEQLPNGGFSTTTPLNRMAFLQDGSLVLRSLRDAPPLTKNVPPGCVPKWLHFAPDEQHWVLVCAETTYLGGDALEWRMLGEPHVADFVDVTWSGDALAVRPLQWPAATLLYDASTGAPRGVLGRTDGIFALMRTFGFPNHFVSITAEGLVIHSPQGAVLGGTNLPGRCTAGAEIKQLGPHTYGWTGFEFPSFVMLIDSPDSNDL